MIKHLMSYCMLFVLLETAVQPGLAAEVITNISTDEDWLYLAGLKDLFSGERWFMP